MPNRYEGQKCPICQSYLFEEDDIVVCPICGAPQHRDCYQSLGHCGLAQHHDTPQQYDLAKARQAAQESNAPATESVAQVATIRCPRCQKEVPEDASFCAYCGAPVGENVPQTPRAPFGGANFMYGFDPYGGVHKKTDIDGITVEQAAEFVGANTHRYIPRFVQLGGKRRVSWNWAAFLLPYGWFFSRKQYKWGFLTAFIMLAATICLIPLQVSLTNAMAAMPSGTYILDALTEIVASGDIGTFEYVMLFLSNILALGTRILSGMFGDYAYRNHVVATVKKIEADEELDHAEAYRKKGGVNPLFLLAAYFIFDLISQFLLTILS